MIDQEKEHWLLLCEQAATEQDPEKLMDLLDKVNRFLEAEENRRRDTPSTPLSTETQLERFLTAKIARIEAPASEDAGKPMAGKVPPFQPVE